MLTGSIASNISRLTNDAVVEIGRLDPNKIDDYLWLLYREPMSKKCVQLKQLRTVIALGEFEHPNKEIQEFIRDNFANMAGTLADTVAHLSLALPLGFSACEVAVTKKKKRVWLESIVALDPRKITFKGRKGKIKSLVYAENTKKEIDYHRILHIANSTLNFNDPFGVAECQAAYPYYKAKQMIMAQMCVAARNNAMGGIIGRVRNGDRQVSLYDAKGKLMTENGQPKQVPATEALLKQLSTFQDNSVLVTDAENDISPIKFNDGANFWNFALNIIESQIMGAFLVPEMTFKEGSGSFANNGLSQLHRSILDSSIESIVNKIRDALIERVCRPLIFWNFGWQKTYGSFGVKATTDPNLVAGQLNNLISAMSMQLIPSTDLDALNKLRDLLGIPPITPEQQLQMQLQQSEIQAMNDQARQPQPQEQPQQEQPQEEGGQYP